MPSVWSIILVICIIAPFVRMVSWPGKKVSAPDPSEVAKDEDANNTSEYPMETKKDNEPYTDDPLVMGVFKTVLPGTKDKAAAGTSQDPAGTAKGKGAAEITKGSTDSKEASGTLLGPEETAKDKGALETSEGSLEIEVVNNEPYSDDPVIMGIFKKTAFLSACKAVTIEDCTDLCNKKFGFILRVLEGRLFITIPRISARGKACDCLMNTAVRKYLTEKGLDHQTFVT